MGALRRRRREWRSVPDACCRGAVAGPLASAWGRTVCASRWSHETSLLAGCVKGALQCRAEAMGQRESQRVFLHGWSEVTEVCERVHFAKFGGMVSAVAAVLRSGEAGAVVDTGDRVAFVCHNAPCSFAYQMAVMALGASCVNLNWKQPQNVLLHMARTARCDSLLADKHFAGTVKRLMEDLSAQVGGAETLFAKGVVSRMVQPHEAAMLAAPALSGIADAPAGRECLILFTSGSTSLPKAVPHTQRGLIWSCEMKYCVDPSPWVAPHAASLSFLPTYHIIGFVNNFLFNLYAGVRCLVYTDPATPITAGTVMAGVAALHPTVVCTVPWLLEGVQRLLTESGKGAFPLVGVEYMLYGGAPMSLITKEQYASMGVVTRSHYGQTELGGCALFTCDGVPNSGCDIFQCLPGVSLELLDPEDGGQVSEGGAGGELALYGHRAATKGYHNLPSGKKPKLQPEGGWATGDLFAHVRFGNTRGGVQHKCREDDLLLLSTGEMTDPVIIEQGLLTHEAVGKSFARLCVLGNQRAAPVLLAELAEKAAARDVLAAVELLWPAVKAVNATQPGYSQVQRKHIVVVDPRAGRSLPVSAKGNVVRSHAEKLFNAEAEAALSMGCRRGWCGGGDLAVPDRESVVEALSLLIKDETGDVPPAGVAVADMGLTSLNLSNLQAVIREALNVDLAVPDLLLAASLDTLADAAITIMASKGGSHGGRTVQAQIASPAFVSVAGPKPTRQPLHKLLFARLSMQIVYLVSGLYRILGWLLGRVPLVSVKRVYPRIDPSQPELSSARFLSVLTAFDALEDALYPTFAFALSYDRELDVAKLEEGLQRALPAMPFLSGTIVEHRSSLVIDHCGTDGIEFCAFDARRSMPLLNLIAYGWYCLAQIAYLWFPSLPRPVTSVRVLVRKGSTRVGLVCSHAALDFPAALQFMQLWARMVVDPIKVEAYRHPLTLRPCALPDAGAFERRRLRGRWEPERILAGAPPERDPHMLWWRYTPEHVARVRKLGSGASDGVLFVCHAWQHIVHYYVEVLGEPAGEEFSLVVTTSLRTAFPELKWSAGTLTYPVTFRRRGAEVMAAPLAELCRDMFLAVNSVSVEDVADFHAAVVIGNDRGGMAAGMHSLCEVNYAAAGQRFTYANDIMLQADIIKTVDFGEADLKPQLAHGKPTCFKRDVEAMGVQRFYGRTLENAVFDKHINRCCTLSNNLYMYPAANNDRIAEMFLPHATPQSIDNFLDGLLDVKHR